MPIDIAYFEFGKAFDRVPHQGLILKCEHYGINGHLISWLSNFLADTFQSVCVNGCQSQWSHVVSGVPQGSILGPCLFLIYVNHLPSTVINDLLMFADVARLFKGVCSNTDIEEFQFDIDKSLHGLNNGNYP